MYLFRNARTHMTTAKVMAHGGCLNVTNVSMSSATIVPISIVGAVGHTTNT